MTETRSGERKGLYRILILSTLLAVVALAIAWRGMSYHAHPVGPHTTPSGAPISGPSSSS